MRLDDTLRTLWIDDTFPMPEGWGQGRSVFGGLVAAAGVALSDPDPDRPLRTLHAQFLRPTTSGPLQGVHTVRRQGKYTRFAHVELSQAGQTTLTLELVSARRRPEATPVEATPMTPLAPVGDFEDMPYLPGVTPEFTQHVAFRWAEGDYPFSGTRQARFRGYCKFRVPAGGVCGLVALLDVWPCPSLALLNTPRPASSVSWTAHLLHVPTALDGWCAFEYETVAADGGLHTVVVRLFDADGRLLAWTEQLVVVFG